MAEKGGKGFSMSQGRKSSLKTTVSMKGKDGSSLMKGKDGSSLMKGKDGSSPMKGRKVQFDTSDSEGGKDSFKTPDAKGDLGKGGKGDKTSKGGGKSSVSKEPTTPELKFQDELPKNTKCLMDCEAALVLQGVQEQLVILSEDPTIKMPVTFDKGLQYAKTGSHYRSPQSVRQVIETLRRHGVSDSEICMIANICPESVNEVFSLIPSLKAKRRKIEEPVKEVLKKLAELKQ